MFHNTLHDLVLNFPHPIPPKCPSLIGRLLTHPIVDDSSKYQTKLLLLVGHLVVRKKIHFLFGWYIIIHNQPSNQKEYFEKLYK